MSMLNINEFDVIKSSLSGTNLIEASAGTGKTYAISIIFLRLIVENNFRIEDILVVTFTIPATMELRMRIRERLRDAVSVIEGYPVEDKTVSLLMENYKGDNIMKQRILTSLKSFDQASVYTIHSFCQQMLVDNAFESGSLFSSEIVNDNALIERGVTDLCRLTLYNTSPALVSYFMDNCSVSELLELYRKRPLSPDLRIEPEDSDADIDSLERCHDLIEELYLQLCEAWGRESGRVTDIFCNSKVLKGNIYREDSMDALIEEMNEYIAGEYPFLLFDRFYNFTSDKIRDSLKKGCEYPVSEVFDICQKIYNACEDYKNAGSLMLISIKKRLFDVIDDLVLSNKSRNNKRSFDDLIKDAQRGLNGKSGLLLEERVRSRYKCALIDEFQDTDNLQFDIFNRLFNNDRTILFLIGDPKQAIYRFRGADIFSYMKASQLMSNRYTLARNWRSRVELIESVNAIFGRCSNPFIFNKIQFYPVRPGDDAQGEVFTVSGKPVQPFDLWLAGDGIDSPENMLLEKLSSEISLLVNRADDNIFKLGGRSVNPGDIAVLVRTRKQGLAVRDAFAAYNIPSVSRGMDNVFNSEEAQALYFIVSAIADPANYNLVKAALSTVAMGGSAGLLQSYHGNSPDGKDGLDGVTSRFYEYRETWLSGGFLNMITGFLEGESVASRLFSLNGGERMVTNINHIAEILHGAEHENDFTPRDLVTWFGNILSSPPDDDEYSMRLERDDDAVNIVTMHACKGLEFPIVYCPFLAHSGDGKDDYVIYHDPADHDRPVLYLDKNVPEEVKAIKASEDLAENVRLLYVALTRAKSACRVMFAPNRNFGKSAAFHIFVKDTGLESAGYSREILVSVLRELAVKSEGRISFSEGSLSEGKTYISEKHPVDDITVREFTGDVKSCWKTYSYSAIAHSFTSHTDEDKKDFQSEFHVKHDRGEGIFGFASGARAGLCIHEIFEKADFSLSDKISVIEICREILVKYRFDLSSDVHLSSMFFNVVNTVLDKDTGLRLSDIGPESRLTELEFSYPVDFFDPVKFRDIFKDGGLYCDKIYHRLAGDNSEPGGMMKGFIDLVFEFEGRYYIADWKSNHLGNSPENYLQDSIIDEMEKHNYFLQYYIYSAALVRYLKHRLGESYNYDRHFGGIYYFFVRGMNPGIKGNPGVFFDRPVPMVLEKLDRYFAGVK